MNQSQKPRPIDETIQKTTQALKSRFVLASKTEIKAWKALIIIMFAAGFFAALVWSAYNQWYIESGATEQTPTTLNNLVPNPSVENGSGSIPSSWSNNAKICSNCIFTWDKTTAHAGSKSLKLKGGAGDSQGYWMAKIDKQKIDPNKVYRFGFWYKANSASPQEFNPKADVSAFIKWVDANGNLKGTIRQFTGSINGSNFGAGLKSVNWTKLYAGEFQVSSAILNQASALAVVLQLDTKGGDTSEIWFDQIEVLDAGPKPADEVRSGNLLKKGSDFALWTESASQKIYQQDTVPEAATKKDKIQIQVAKNDSEPFQLAVKPNADWDKVSWEWADFQGPVTLNENIKLTKNIMKYYRVGYLPFPNALPDPLPVETSSALSGNQNSPFWFLVEAPESAQAGTYTSLLTLKQGSTVKAAIPIELKVLNFSLPKEPTIGIQSSVNVAPATEIEGGDPSDFSQLLATAKRYYKTVLTHRAKVLSTFADIPVSITTNGADVATDTSELKKNLDAIKELDLGDCKNIRINGVLKRGGADKWQWRTSGYAGGGASPDIGTVSYEDSGAVFDEDSDNVDEYQSQDEASLPSASDAGCTFPKCINIFQDTNNTQFNPKFVELFGKHVKNIMAALKDKGCYAHPQIKFVDEPGVSDMAQVHAIANVASLLNDIDENIVPTSSGFPHRDWMRPFDRWEFAAVRQMPLVSEELASAKQKKANSIYANGIPTHEKPILKTRLFEWALWKEDFAGALNWWSIDAWYFFWKPSSRPVRFNGEPTGPSPLPSGTTTADLKLKTDRTAVCRYSTALLMSYGSMTSAFSTKDGKSHSAALSGLTDGKLYKYYVRCKGSDGTLNTDDFIIAFSINNSAGTQPPPPSKLWTFFNPWEATRRTTGNLLYPKKYKEAKDKFIDYAPQQPEGPVTSLRWEMMRQGLEDYEYFKLLKQLISQNPNSPAIASAKAALNRINEAINGTPFTSGAPFSAGPLAYGYAHINDAAKVDAIRNQIAQAIDVLKNPPPTPVSCGNAVCEADKGETCSSCPRDCGVCPIVLLSCGNGACEADKGESCSSCSGDCGLCPAELPSCGDGQCKESESCSSCDKDCGVCAGLVNDPHIPVLFIKNSNFFLSSGKPFYTQSKNVSFKGNLPDLAGGKVRIFQDGKIIKIVKIGTSGAWKKKIGIRKSRTFNFQFKYYDRAGKEDYVSENFSVVKKK